MINSPLTAAIEAQKQGEARGITSICSANPTVLEVSFAHAKSNGFPLLIESTCNQVNQFGGYTGQTPEQFMASLHQLAEKHRFPKEQLIVGGDHLGPNPWRHEPVAQAMEHAKVLVKGYVEVGYTKIHLDTSMKLGDDARDQLLPSETIAKRTADLAKVAETTYRESGKEENKPLYVIGTEVPVPGGVEGEEEDPPPVTTPQSAQETIETTRNAFYQLGLEDAWKRVIAVVVQPGVEYGNEQLFDYQADESGALSAFVKGIDRLVFEAHSTDYQTRGSLHELVRDQFAILKVGPGLTFAFREAIFALAEIEQVLVDQNAHSHIREVIDGVMTANPKYWRSYYPGDAHQQWTARQFSLSDRIRYYWPAPKAQKSLRLLITNLSHAPIPLPLLSQYLPEQYHAVRNGRIPNEPNALIRDKITAVLDDYAFACGQI